MQVFHIHFDFIFGISALISIAVMVAVRKFRDFAGGPNAATTKFSEL
jgi:hypothetical protein